MKCEDCIHYEVCTKMVFGGRADDCKFYKDKSRFIELPCKVGDFVYIAGVVWDCTLRDCLCCNNEEDVEKSNCPYKAANRFLFKKKFQLEMIPNIGKTVFLTIEEAENALKERENE